ncbi:hypothetical protein [Candidatus Enterococcus ikei]|uniref:Uncharacterized protein n=1 Tax=Candidatus Enterococcus ikei TaxID=2815326 RepID=A0ABS3GUK8_9ENTE|nr:hypothetical protein [Enterococcus sp. DIV0869a]MBO0438943.1 hypothetical protein [Enterococcus sp. DIV0869a]
MLYPTELRNKKITTELTVDEIATMAAWYESLVFAEFELEDSDNELVCKLNELTGNKLIFEQWKEEAE